MNFKQIFTTKDPLARVPFLIGVVALTASTLALYFAFAVIAKSIFNNQSALVVLLFVILMVVLQARRLVDAGFKSWTTAIITIFAIAAVLYFVFGIIPVVAKIGALAYWGLLLGAPTGSLVKADEPPPRNSW